MLDLIQQPEVSVPPDEHARDPLSQARLLSGTLFGLAARADASYAVVPDAVAALHASGLPLSVFPRRFGGDGLIDDGAGERLAAVLRLIGAGDLSVARIFEGHVNAVTLLMRFGRAGQIAGFARSVGDGALSGVWNAEGRVPLTATADTAGWHLAGDKILASGLGTVTHPIVTPRVDGRVVMLLCPPLDTARFDLASWTPLGMRASATGTVHLDGLSLPPDAVVGAPDDYARQPTFSGGAWRFCAVHLGAAERLLDLFRAHLRQRGRDGDPYQKARVAAATAACVTARLWIARAAATMTDESPDMAVAYVNLVRTITERACLDVIEVVQRGVGLAAFMRPDPIERIARDLATYLRQPVPDAAMADAAVAVLASDRSTFDLWSPAPTC